VNEKQVSASMRVRKFLIVLFSVMFIVLFALEIFIDAYYHEYRPAQPQPDQGRIYATVLSKGVVVYLTKEEKLIYQLSMPLTFASIFIALLLDRYWKQEDSHKKFKP
jgi:hypothetical protein